MNEPPYIRFIRVRVGSLRRAKVSSGSFEFARVHWCVPRSRRLHSGSLGFTLARLGVVGFILVRVGSIVLSYRSPRSFGFALVHSCAPNGRRVHSDSRGFTPACLLFVGFNRARKGVVGFIGDRLG